MDSVSGKPRMPIMGRTIVTLIVLAVAPIAINAQALAQLVDVPPEVIGAVNVINKRTPIWIPATKDHRGLPQWRNNFVLDGKHPSWGPMDPRNARSR